MPGKTNFETFRDLVVATAARYGYDPALLAAQCEQESGWQARALSPKAAGGLMQFIPSTWGQWGLGRDRNDPAASLDAGVRFMQHLMKSYKGDVRFALAAYNCGQRGVANAAKMAGSWTWETLYNYLPAETRGYVPAILEKRLPKFRQLLTGAAGIATSGAVVALVAVGLGLLAGRVFA